MSAPACQWKARSGKYHQLIGKRSGDDRLTALEGAPVVDSSIHRLWPLTYGKNSFEGSRMSIGADFWTEKACQAGDGIRLHPTSREVVIVDVIP